MTGSDQNYIDKIKPYLDSIDINSNFDSNFLIYLNENDIKLDNKIKVLKMDPNKYLYKNSINCLQHGEFIKSNGFDDLIADDDVIVFTDGDMILQRNLSEDELIKFRNLKHGDIFIGYNESPTDNLLKEYHRLLPTGYVPNIFKIDLSKIKCYNSGVIGATKSTFKKILDHYGKLYGEVDKMLRYYAKQQWLISYIIGTENFNIIEMGYEMHNHTHYSPSEGSRINNKIITYNDQIVLFKHKWDF
jgi:hypothetical protein